LFIEYVQSIQQANMNYFLYPTVFKLPNSLGFRKLVPWKKLRERERERESEEDDKLNL